MKIRAWAVMSDLRRKPDQLHLSVEEAREDIINATDIHPESRWWIQVCTVVIPPKKKRAATKARRRSGR